MVTVRDVARSAGVSISTVSRALSAPAKVAAPTRERVAAAAAALGYLPNRAAAGLRAGRTGTLGLLVPDLANPYFSAVAKGVAERAREHGLGVFVVDAEEDPGLEAELLRGLAHQTDGVVLASPRAVEADRDVVGTKPVVVVNQALAGAVAIGSDDAAGVELAVDHLHALGHRRIAYVGGPATSWSDEQRRAALRAAVQQRPGLEACVLGPHAPTADGGTVAADAVVAAGATAAITFNDVVAVGLVRRLRELGKEVPGDLSVVSFDDTFLAPLVTPALTSVSTDLAELGRRATDLLVGLLAGVDATTADPTPLLLPARLVVRASTTALRNEDRP